MNTLLEVKSLSYTPPAANFLTKAEVEVLKNISFSVSRDSITGIAGESGSGKTTLAKIITGLLQPGSGSIIMNATENRGNNRTSRVQILFQNNGEIIHPNRQIFDAVKDYYEVRHGKNKANLQEIKKIMSFVNIHEDMYSKKGNQLSGGEQQRAAIAKVIALEPELLILDEPFSAQDPKSRANLVNLFKKINKDYKITILCISHNLKLLKNLCNYIMIMYKGEIVEQGKCDEIFNSPSHPYTKHLLKAENYSLDYDELNQFI